MEERVERISLSTLGVHEWMFAVYRVVVDVVAWLACSNPVEAAYLTAVSAFAEDTGVTRLTIRDPAVSGLVHFGVEPLIDGHGLFPPDLTGYHDGARITLEVGRELVRAMLRDNGAWCRLESENPTGLPVGSP